ncbi:MAG: HAMP domain-containing histidine kinase [Bacteroidetes bacterium]|nr:HAMP domain-containing histidine kinase [Bacteroidota bacterium]
MNRSRFDRLLFNTDQITSANAYRRALLRGQLCLIGMAVGIIYIGIDLANGITISLMYYALLILFSVMVFWLNRQGKFSAANYLFFSTLLFLIYIFVDNDTSHTGVSSYLIIYMLIALILSGYKRIKTGLIFSALALLVFFLAYYADLPPLIPRTTYTSVYIQISFVTNFIVSFSVAFALMIFSIHINYKIEQELLQNNQLLIKTNRELDRFVYSASHDLRAPLSSLLGLIDIANRTQDFSEVKYCLTLMETRVKDLDAFIKEIIDYSRNARQELRPEIFNLLELVKESAAGLKYSAEAENIFIQYAIPTDLSVRTDRARLKVILTNLIGNALKYSNSSRPDPWVKVLAQQTNNILTITIEDNGTGIEPEHLPKIFEMFYRASEKSQGSGLGLYIVKETLDKLQGKIAVTSVPGQGSAFRVEILV